MNGIRRMRILTQKNHDADTNERVAILTNDDDPYTLKDRLTALDRIELRFPHFTDGRAYSQAYLLRKRLGFTGDLRATGDVLIDQLVQMERTGFSSAVLKDGADVADAERQFARFAGYYQGDLASH
ncbi:oxidoreductase [Caballeronia pedi]|uniref:Oxidoreductase n=1 Tax=Caballeronia pedi TaxID=1777141 RepID=A0A158A8Z2_9BURK|nr:DUF934 domain-containing protein [Caballeronia pedi]SAK54230.1 oxidoreductase [Caballeronia pedi]